MLYYAGMCTFARRSNANCVCLVLFMDRVLPLYAYTIIIMLAVETENTTEQFDRVLVQNIPVSFIGRHCAVSVGTNNQFSQLRVL